MTLILAGTAIGLVAGVLSGFVGIGGGIVIVPALVFLGLTQREASGTSLAALLMPVGVFGVVVYAQRHEVRAQYAVGIAIGLTIGAAVGASFAGHVSNQWLGRAFGVLMLITAVKFLLFPA